MNGLRLAGIGAGLAAALTIGGCAYDDYGRGYGGGGYYQGGYDAPVPQGGYAQGGYGDGSGYDQGGYDQGYYDDGGGYGGGYYQGGGGYYGGGYDGFVDGPDYGYGYGWYNNFYYPGFGVFIYDRGGHRHPWRNGDRDYWRNHPRPHGDHPPRPGEGGWRGPQFPNRGATPSAPNHGSGRGDWQVGRGGAPAPGDSHSRPFIRRPMTLEQRNQLQAAPGQPPVAAGRGFYRGAPPQGQVPQGQAPQYRAFQGRPEGGPQPAPAASSQGVPNGQWRVRQGGEMRGQVPQGRAARASGSTDQGSGGHHHRD